MNGSDVRVLLVANYEFGEIDFITARRHLAQKAWAAVRTAASVGCYLAAYTFPRWATTDGMMAFAPLQEAIGATSDTCVCYQVNKSPIEDLISNDPTNFCQEETHSPKLLPLLAKLLEDRELSTLLVWVGECNLLPNVQQAGRAEGCAVIRQKFNDGLQEDIALLIK
jgi:hypothetical protein